MQCIMNREEGDGAGYESCCDLLGVSQHSILSHILSPLYNKPTLIETGDRKEDWHDGAK